MICLKCGNTETKRKREMHDTLKMLCETEICTKCGCDVFLNNGKRQTISHVIGMQKV